MTPHNNAKKGEIAKTVIMPGDPKRTQYIAENFLENPKLVNEVRSAYAYTGTYNGKPVTVMASGMGMPSMGIYSYELFTIYEVENIIRIGSCGSLQNSVNIGDIVLATSAFTESNFAFQYSDEPKNLINSSSILNETLQKTAKALDINLLTGTINTSDLFYTESTSTKAQENNCLAVEMETFGLFFLADKLNKNAASVLTVTDNLLTNEHISAEERQTGLNKAIKLILESL